jgi:hypothetical protein
MLRAEDNKFLTESGPGTGMGELLRRFWLPVLLAKELPEPDGTPKKIVVLGEELLAFRDTRGVVGVIDQIARIEVPTSGSGVTRNAASAASITAGSSIPTALASICRRPIPTSTPRITSASNPTPCANGAT